MARFMMPVLLVQDVPAAARFYQELFDLSVAFQVGEEYLVLQDAFALWQRESARGFMQLGPAAGPAPADRETELYFESEDVAAFAAALEKRKDLHMVHGLKTEPWGQRGLRFYDLDGYVVEVAESMDDVARRFLAEGLGAEEVQSRTMMPLDYIQRLAKDG